MAETLISAENIVARAARWIDDGAPPRSAFKRTSDRWSRGTDLAGENIVSAFEQRRPYVERFGFSIPCAEAVQAVLRLGPLVEIGAGPAAWSAVLRVAGADIVTTDLRPAVGPDAPYGFAKTWVEVRPMDATAAVRNWSSRSVLCSWPCYEEEWSYRAARAVRKGRAFALVHEGPGGCVGTDKLFKLLYGDFRVERHVALPTWPGIHDRLTIFRRVRA